MQLYKPVQHRLSAYCRVVAGNEDKALELIQETLAAAYENFQTIRDASAFQFFLIGIARNCHLKQQRRKKIFREQSEIKSSNIGISSDSIEMQYDYELLHQCINQLNTVQRETILMFHIMGFQIKEIARNLSISEAAVKNRLVRGRERLRVLFSDKESELIQNTSVNKTNSHAK